MHNRSFGEIRVARLLPFRGAALVLVACTAIGASACRKAKTATDSGSDQPADIFGRPVAPKGEAKPSSSGGGSVLPVRPTLPTGWLEFKHPEGVYSLYVPAQPKRPKMSAPSLNLKKPLQPLEGRESIYEIAATPTQPFTCTMQLIVFHPDSRAGFSAYGQKPATLPAHWTLKADRAVTWGGLPAFELVVEKSFPGHTPERVYSVMRNCLAGDRVYEFLLERTDRMPDATERAAFFDSFKPGN